MSAASIKQSAFFLPQKLLRREIAHPLTKAALHKVWVNPPPRARSSIYQGAHHPDLNKLGVGDWVHADWDKRSQVTFLERTNSTRVALAPAPEASRRLHERHERSNCRPLGFALDAKTGRLNNG